MIVQAGNQARRAALNVREIADTFDETSTKQNHDDEIRELKRQLSETQAELTEQQIQNEAMINSLGEGLIQMDENGLITTINSYALESLGFTDSQLIGKWFPKAIVAVDKHTRPIEPLSRPIIRALTSGQTISDYLHYIKGDGSIMPVFVTASPILINGKPAGVIEVFRDLTKERQLDIAKDEFVSIASHQLRTPATAVMMILSMLSNGDFGSLTSTQQRYLDKAVRSNERQLQIIEDLLNAARVDAGKMRLDLEYIDLNPLLRDVVSDQVAAAMARRQTIVLNTPDHCHVMADGQKIRMIIDNLLSNASKYSYPDSKIEITLKHQQRHAIISVRDQGVGLTPDQQSRLFTKFTRFDNELSASVSGTGLGLFLVKGIVDLHGGDIKVTSELGQGSIFTIYLPLQPEVA